MTPGRTWGSSTGSCRCQLQMAAANAATEVGLTPWGSSAERVAGGHKHAQKNPSVERLANAVAQGSSARRPKESCKRRLFGRRDVGSSKECAAKSHSPRGGTSPTAMGARPTEVRSSFIAHWRGGGGQQVNGRGVGRDPLAKPAAVGDEEKLVKSYLGLPRIPPPPVAQAPSPCGSR